MKRLFIRVIFLLAVFALIQRVASALDYLWLTNCELTRFHETIPFITGDTLEGPVHSDGQISIMGSPVFLDRVSTSAQDFDHQAGYAPQFLGPAPLFNVPHVFNFGALTQLRTIASNSGWYFTPPPHHLCLLQFMEGSVEIFTSRAGVPFDSSNHQTMVFTQNTTVMFFDCPIRVMGLISGRIVVGSSHEISIENDIRYVDSDPLTGQTPSDSPNYLTLASERNIKISNTVANGRENSNGLGRAQTDPNFTSVVITAALYALGESLTFESQNDPDSGYDYGSTDERGTVSIFGGIVQMRRGYFHRANRGGTGYLKHIRFDTRLPWWNDYVSGVANHVHPDTLDFGDIPIGVNSTDTATIAAGIPTPLGGVQASLPFHAQRIEPLFGTYFRIPVSITPSLATTYQGMLTVSTDYHVYQAVLRARGVPPHSPELSSPETGSVFPATTTLSASPNPFNLSTDLRYTLTEEGPVKLIVYNIQGREVRHFEMTDETAGEHLLHLNAEDMASGVYVVQLISKARVTSLKLLLLK